MNIVTLRYWHRGIFKKTLIRVWKILVEIGGPFLFILMNCVGFFWKELVKKCGTYRVIDLKKCGLRKSAFMHVLLDLPALIFFQTMQVGACGRFFEQYSLNEYVSQRFKPNSARLCLICWKYVVRKKIIKRFCPTDTYLLDVRVARSCEVIDVTNDLVVVLAVIATTSPIFLATAGFTR